MVQVETTERDGDPGCAYVGQDEDGQWVVRDAGGLYGAFLSTRARRCVSPPKKALRIARFATKFCVFAA